MATPTNSLSLSFPEIVTEWDDEKNGSLTPDQVTAGSDKKVHWKCREFGHQFETAISARTRSGKGSGCPFCSNSKVLAGFNDLESQFPIIAEEWDFEANGALRPDEVLTGSHSKVHWKCRKFGHQWVAKIENRTRAGGGCPVCSNKQVLAGFNDLESQFPDIAEEWDFGKSGGLRPNQVTPGSNKKVHWQCRKFGHQWEATIDTRTNGRGCPVCTNRKVLAGFNDLESQFPDIAEEWDFGKSGALRPNQVTPGSNKKVHWQCRKFGHQWEAAIKSRTGSGVGCPVCANRKVLAGFNDLESQFPDIAEEWDYEKNGALRPDEVLAGGHTKVHWKCRKAGHQWVAKVVERTTGSGCPVCSSNKVLAGFNDLLSQFPDIAEEWDYEKNGALRPDEVLAGSHSKVHWKCRKAGHQWAAAIVPRTRLGVGCPVCSSNKVLAGFNDLLSQFPDIAEEWDYEKNGAL
ncbi:zinc-ribbon domain-containing protein, partial [Rhodococcus opacus]|uniref:zinc-ribbon domain-containing protein n=1 Tax=Rhodococcus opacus TaxID=37919 RepID=UPI0024731DE9